MNHADIVVQQLLGPTINSSSDNTEKKKNNELIINSIIHGGKVTAWVGNTIYDHNVQLSNVTKNKTKNLSNYTHINDIFNIKKINIRYNIGRFDNLTCENEIRRKNKTPIIITNSIHIT